MVHVFYRLMVFNICVKFHKYVKRFNTYGVGMKIVNTRRAITPKVGKPDLCFMCSACCLMVFKIFVKFLEKSQVVFKLWSGQENCLHTKGNNSKSRKTRVMVHVFCTSSYGV